MRTQLKGKLKLRLQLGRRKRKPPTERVKDMGTSFRKVAGQRIEEIGSTLKKIQGLEDKKNQFFRKAFTTAGTVAVRGMGRLMNRTGKK